MLNYLLILDIPECGDQSCGLHGTCSNIPWGKPICTSSCLCFPHQNIEFNECN